VMKSLSVGHDLEELVEVGGGSLPARQLRVFAGYAGWGPGQLDEELRRDSWLVQPATLELVFHPKPADLWRQVLLGKGDWQSRLLAGSPEDLAWN
jgi:putative transcriptional regulator